MTSAVHPSPGRPERRRRAEGAPGTRGRARGRRTRLPRSFTLVGWVLLAGTAAVVRFLDGTPEVAVLPPVPAPETFPVAAAPVAARAEPVHAPVKVVAAPPKRPLPKRFQKPFETMHAFASPLLMPRLSLPRALVPRFTELSGLLSRARPGEPVPVMLSAYCLNGVTRRGLRVRPGIIAADPRVFPLARHVELFAGGRFLGRFLVDDTGKKIRGTRIDIWTPDCGDAIRFGMRSGVATLVAVGPP